MFIGGTFSEITVRALGTQRRNVDSVETCITGRTDLSVFRYSVTNTGLSINNRFGRAIAQAVSRWLPTAAARVQTRARSSGICGRQSGTGAGFLRVLRFPLPIFIPPNSPSS
jgi:hypothetical protein